MRNNLYLKSNESEERKLEQKDIIESLNGSRNIGPTHGRNP
jgi:hypothetical protein